MDLTPHCTAKSQSRGAACQGPALSQICPTMAWCTKAAPSPGGSFTASPRANPLLLPTGSGPGCFCAEQLMKREPSHQLTCFTAPQCQKHGPPPSPYFNTDFHGANPDAHQFVPVCKPGSEYFLFSRNTHKENFTGLVRASWFGHAAPQMNSGILADPLPSARTPCPLPAAPGFQALWAQHPYPGSQMQSCSVPLRILWLQEPKPVC